MGRVAGGGPPSRESWPHETRPHPSELLPPGEAGYPLTQGDSEGLRRKGAGGNQESVVGGQSSSISENPSTVQKTHERPKRFIYGGK